MLRAFSTSNACFTRDERLSRRVDGIGLDLKPPKLRSWRCIQPRATRATANVAVVGKLSSIPRTAVIVRSTLLAGGGRKCHADLRLEVAAVRTAMPAASCCMMLLCGTWYGAWACAFLSWMDGAMDSNTFSTEQLDWHSQSNRRLFSTGSYASRIAQYKTFGLKMLIFNCARSSI